MDCHRLACIYSYSPFQTKKYVDQENIQLWCEEEKLWCTSHNPCDVSWCCRHFLTHCDIYAAEGLKEFCQHFVSSDAFFVEIQEWLQYNLENLPLGSSKFCSPFQLDELRLLDYAIEGVPFQLLFRMPSPHSIASPSGEYA